MTILLDTSAYSQLKRGHEALARRVRGSMQIIFSPIVGGELLHGFRRGSRFDENVEELRRFLENRFVSVVPVTMTTADRFSRITHGLREKGRPIPTNDIWIAAQSMETGAELLSFDGHFAHVDGLAWDLLSA
jgi:tRNA(fMet)-specific endonuclease VapC